MDKFLFADGTDICLYDGGTVKKKASKFIEKYKNAVVSVERAKSWKHSGEGAQFRGDVRVGMEESAVTQSINGVYINGAGEAVYSFTVDRTSGIYVTDVDDDKAAETHIISSVEYEFFGGCLDSSANVLATSVRRDCYTSSIALFDLKSGDYKTLTDGDTLDGDPFISPDDGNVIYFTSRGVGRDMNGVFAGYSPAALCRLNMAAVEVEEIASSQKFGYMKPVVNGGRLYAVKVPAKDKSPNPLIEIVLIPFRIIQAIANFINVFVTAFTGKSLASGGSNPAKGRVYDSRKEYVKGNLINVDKELKRNAKKDKRDYGFIPQSWQLVDVESGKVISSGVADYDIMPDGTFIVTNGKRIFAVRGGKKEKLCDAECCLSVSCLHASEKHTDLFEF